MKETRKFDITIDDHRFIGEEEYGGQIFISQVFIEGIRKSVFGTNESDMHFLRKD